MMAPHPLISEPQCSQLHTCFHTCGHFVTETRHDIDCPSNEENCVCFAMIIPTRPRDTISIQHASTRCPWCAHDYRCPRVVPTHDTRAFNLRRSDVGWDQLPESLIAERARHWEMMKEKASIGEADLKDMRYVIEHAIGNEEYEFEHWRDQKYEEEYRRPWTETDRKGIRDGNEAKDELGSDAMKNNSTPDSIDLLIARLEKETPAPFDRVSQYPYWQHNEERKFSCPVPAINHFYIQDLHASAEFASPTQTGSQAKALEKGKSRAQPDFQIIPPLEELSQNLDVTNGYMLPFSNNHVAYTNNLLEDRSYLLQETGHLHEHSSSNDCHCNSRDSDEVASIDLDDMDEVFIPGFI